MNMKKFVAATIALCGTANLFAAAVDAMTQDPNVLMTSLSVKQRYPWNGKVDIDFSFTSSIPEAYAFINFKAEYVNAAGETVTVPMKTFDQFTTAFATNAGTYRVTWDSTADAPNLVVTNLKYTVTANMAKYMVIDLSKGTAATAEDPYPVFYYEDVPDFPGVEKGKWDDYHKTTNLVLRLIQPGTYMQAWSDGSSPTSYRRSAYQHSATITKPFYMAVFELTQAQCMLIQGYYGISSMRSFTGGNRQIRPASETYQNVRGRGYNGTINWPFTGSEVSDASLLGKLRGRARMDSMFRLKASGNMYAAAAARQAVFGMTEVMREYLLRHSSLKFPIRTTWRRLILFADTYSMEAMQLHSMRSAKPISIPLPHIPATRLWVQPPWVHTNPMLGGFTTCKAILPNGAME